MVYLYFHRNISDKTAFIWEVRSCMSFLRMGLHFLLYARVDIVLVNRLLQIWCEKHLLSTGESIYPSNRTNDLFSYPRVCWVGGVVARGDPPLQVDMIGCSVQLVCCIRKSLTSNALDVSVILVLRHAMYCIFVRRTGRKPPMVRFALDSIDAIDERVAQPIKITHIKLVGSYNNRIEVSRPIWVSVGMWHCVENCIAVAICAILRPVMNKKPVAFISSRISWVVKSSIDDCSVSIEAYILHILWTSEIKWVP